MNAPFIPESAPFSPDQRAWLNGFFAGVFSRAPAGTQPASLPSAPELKPLTILFGSQTGTAESLAKQMAKEASKRGFVPTVIDLAQFSLAKLASEKNVLIITSTYGEGEPPDNARAFHAALGAAAAPSLNGLRFSVCSLGDTNYTLFCQAGKDFDTRLEKLGATRVHARADCDLDYEAPFRAWLDASLSALGHNSSNAPQLSASPQIKNQESEIKNEGGFSRTNPFSAKVLGVHLLNGTGSAKEVNHVEFSLEGSGLSYEAGDALGVYPRNCPQLVSEILAALNCDGEEAVSTPAGELPIRTALTQNFDLGKPTPDLLEALGLSASPTILDVLDALRAASPASLTSLRSEMSNAAKVSSLLKKLQPRLYSISSSPKAHPGQVHLTVGAVRYEVGGRARKGVCSTFLAEQAVALGTTGVFVHSNKAFRPPASSDIPMIMVGPGTGIAPFRAFLEERIATAAKGKNWLFFGDQKSSADFLYRDELLGWKESGLLARLDLAFSRDQAEKIYVQQRMRENAAELFAWLEQGAHFYVCGDASRMAKDVDAALHDVIVQAGGKTADEAAAYVQNLRAAKRYQRDVY